MKIKQAIVPRKNPAKIFSIIEDVLSTSPDTQVFIANEIYYELKKNSTDYHISSPNYFKCHHYEHDDLSGFGGETWLELNSNSKSVAKGSFIENCQGYRQLVEFKSTKVDDYTHYLAGFKQLLLIRFKKVTNKQPKNN